MEFNPEINLGHLLTVISFLVAAAALHFGLNARLSVAEARLTIMEKTVERLVKAYEEQIKLNAKFLAFVREHGKEEEKT